MTPCLTAGGAACGGGAIGGGGGISDGGGAIYHVIIHANDIDNLLDSDTGLGDDVIDFGAIKLSLFSGWEEKLE